MNPEPAWNLTIRNQSINYAPQAQAHAKETTLQLKPIKVTLHNP